MTERSISREVDEDEVRKRSERPHGARQLCCNCVFWEASRYVWDALREDRKSGVLFSDTYGECRRHAPAAVEVMRERMGDLIGRIAWAIEELANVSHEEEGRHVYEIASVEDYQVNHWPMVNAYDWCGDFVERKP